jgi:GT2 family glycosyltransferase
VTARRRPRFTPRQLEERELAGGIAPIEPRTSAGGDPYRAVRVLVRLHSYPLGLVDLELPGGGLDAGELARAIERQLGPSVAEHMARDGARPPGSLAEIRDEPAPSCQAERRAVLADAPRATVVIPTRDRPERLRAAVDSVLASTYPRERFDVVVSDNAPPDSRTRDLVESTYGGDGRVRYLLAERPGSASARNEGAARADGEIVAFADDDEVVDRHWLAELAAGFRTAPGVACVTGLVLPAEIETWAQQLFEEYGGFGKGFRPRVLDTGPHRPADPLFPFDAAGHVGSGNSVAFRRDALLDAGGYDPQLGNGTPTRSGEDWELFLRLLRRGHAIAYQPSALVHHTHRRGYEELREQVHDYGVGIAAALARTVAREPAAVVEIARRLPAGARHLLSSRSSKNRNWTASYPRDLRRAELLGLSRGAAAYLRSRRATRT